ncbi:MAG: AN1-type zinc finger domain-containing protein [Nitrososphaerales archaeon]
MTCRVCGKSEALPFKCAYCGGFFCAEHRLPENHSCPELWLAKPPVERWRGVERIDYVPLRRRYVGVNRLGSTEAKHLTLASILVLLVGLSLGWRSDLTVLAGTALIFLASFMLHELAHRFSAKRRGLWAEFKLEPYGALLTAISIVSPFKIIAPGAVFVVGAAGFDVIGKVALSGPLTNLILMVVLYVARLFVPSDIFWVNIVLGYGIYVNAIIAFFNLLPFASLDGRKVLMWSRNVWLLFFALSLALLLASVSGFL